MMHEAGEAIVKGEFPGYFKRRFQWWYPEGVYPEWAVGALRGGGGFTMVPMRRVVLGCPSSGREIDFFDIHR